MYNVSFFENLVPVLQHAIPNFHERQFIYHVFDREWPVLELKQRTRQITKALNEFLPASFPEATTVLIEISRLLRKTVREQQYPYIFIPDYIELYGLNHFSASMKAIEEVTKLVSAEFAIRPFIIRYPNETMKYLLKWSKHPEASVRRLSSEGCRPRLPWAMGIPELKKNPAPILTILENLKADPSEYVRRSVANNLNDIAKDYPDIVIKLAKRWRGECIETDWIVKHGCRTLLKKGHESALALHGFDAHIKVSVTNLKLPPKIRIGDLLPFRFTFMSNEKSSAACRLAYAIDYQTRSGKISKKIFKLKEGDFEPGISVDISRSQSFSDFSTRKHYPGKHMLRILVNGKEVASGEFLVC